MITVSVTGRQSLRRQGEHARSRPNALRLSRNARLMSVVTEPRAPARLGFLKFESRVVAGFEIVERYSHLRALEAPKIFVATTGLSRADHVPALSAHLFAVWVVLSLSRSPSKCFHARRFYGAMRTVAPVPAGVTETVNRCVLAL